MINPTTYVKSTIVILHHNEGWIQQYKRVDNIVKRVVKNPMQSPNSSPKNVKIEVKKFNYKKGK